MAYFAEIKSNDNTVLRVVVVNDSDVSDNGGEYTSTSETWVANNIVDDPSALEDNGATYWKQTSYNNTVRGVYAGIGMTYNSSTDKFIPIKPFASWIFDSTQHTWLPPIAFCENTDEGACDWDEGNLRWKNTDNTKYWNGTAWQNV